MSESSDPNVKVIVGYEGMHPRVREYIDLFQPMLQELRIELLADLDAASQATALRAWFSCLQSEMALALCGAYLAAPSTTTPSGEPARREHRNRVADEMVAQVTKNIAAGISHWLNSLPVSPGGRLVFQPKMPE